MNMSVGELIHDRLEADRLQGPQSAQGRLREWSRVRHWEALNVWPKESAMYAVLHNPGRATNTQSDGGMASKMDRMEAALAAHNRMVEVAKALQAMPIVSRLIVDKMYVVSAREAPKSDRVVAEALGITRLEAIRRLERAYGWLAHELCLPPI